MRKKVFAVLGAMAICTGMILGGCTANNSESAATEKETVSEKETGSETEKSTEKKTESETKSEELSSQETETTTKTATEEVTETETETDTETETETEDCEKADWELKYDEVKKYCSYRAEVTIPGEQIPYLFTDEGFFGFRDGKVQFFDAEGYVEGTEGFTRIFQNGDRILLHYEHKEDVFDTVFSGDNGQLKVEFAGICSSDPGKVETDENGNKVYEFYEVDGEKANREEYAELFANAYGDRENEVAIPFIDHWDNTEGKWNSLDEYPVEVETYFSTASYSVGNLFDAKPAEPIFTEEELKEVASTDWYKGYKFELDKLAISVTASDSPDYPYKVYAQFFYLDGDEIPEMIAQVEGPATGGWTEFYSYRPDGSIFNEYLSSDVVYYKEKQGHIVTTYRHDAGFWLGAATFNGNELEESFDGSGGRFMFADIELGRFDFYSFFLHDIGDDSTDEIGFLHFYNHFYDAIPDDEEPWVSLSGWEIDIPYEDLP